LFEVFCLSHFLELEGYDAEHAAFILLSEVHHLAVISIFGTFHFISVIILINNNNMLGFNVV